MKIPSTKVEVLEKSLVYDGFFKLERYRLRHVLFAGGWSRPLTRELLERGHAAALLLYDPALDSVLLIEQFRIGALETENAWLLEIVAGMVEEGESAELVARREAEEEAGIRAEELAFICEYHVSPGGTSERIALYCGRADLSKAGGIHGLAEENEDIRALVVPFAQAMTLLAEGHIRSATPIIALQWLALHHQSLREKWADGERELFSSATD
jgi:ADP-ribose pyrophosphatase